MGQATNSSQLLIADALRRRLAFEHRPATKSLLVVVLLWYGVESIALAAGWPAHKLAWAFTTASFPHLSPGLVFAIISHTPPPNVTHLLGNIAFLWLFAGESEQHMHRYEVVGFFVTTAWASVIVSTAIRGTGTMGASGGALAFVGFYGIHRFLGHRDTLGLDTRTYSWREPAALRSCWQILVLLLPAAIMLYSAGQWIGVVDSGRVDVLGHLLGLGLGVCYAVWRG